MATNFPCDWKGYWVENWGDVYHVESEVFEAECQLELAVEEFIHQKLAEEFGLSPETQFE